MRRPFLALLAIAAMSAACGGQTASQAPGQTAGTPTQAPGSTSAMACAGDAPAEDVASAVALIDGANLGDNATITPIQAIRFTPAGTLAACKRLGEGVGGDALWAAAWVYATGGTDPAPLLALLANDEPTIRAIAAGGLVSLGHLEGLDALVELISVAAGLRGSLPPVTVARYAAVTLSRVTEGAVGDVSTSTSEERAAASIAWQQWLDANRSRLQFDTDQRLWRVT